ncbi:bifunctional 2-polyprenyl-6-hydroxyphenol methylase/3-demethylubiquinol 3-O-methyltransferase UbiG [Paenibacillus sp. UNC499MF]|uniref:class I SAM-dependent methyltransferase n=1 Tax=Paenibacillus sp. UNC499MF TaxID=1502751 RepID=UPI00089FFB98|nr:class I SAM-dependent methyltransferase [Paenibacillus sp. UNC499MF]SEG58838.1 methyltransferase, FkbM family [Paenibacillus sp. UNC499MF]
MTDERFDSAVWEKAWKDDPYTGVNKMKRAGIDPAHTLDSSADSFNKEVFSEEGRARARRIMNWLEDQGVELPGSSVLDIGAASGGFSVPFAEKGADVTAVETSPPLVELLQQNSSGLANGTVKVVHEPFENIDLEARGWERAFDLVFVSMCPVLVDWASVERVLSCAKAFCYMSLSVGSRTHSLVDEVWPLVTDRPRETEHLEMIYLTQLLLLKGYSYQSLVTREMKTTTVSKESAFNETIKWLNMYGIPADERVRHIVSRHLDTRYPGGQVEIRQGGRFGKVLVRMQTEHMYDREDRIQPTAAINIE